VSFLGTVSHGEATHDALLPSVRFASKTETLLDIDSDGAEPDQTNEEHTLASMLRLGR